jgi:hypothetical protein
MTSPSPPALSPSLVNIDTVTAVTFVTEGSSVRQNLRNFVQGKQMLMAQTAVDEFQNIVQGSGGPKEQARAAAFLQRVMPVSDQPSLRAQQLRPTRGIGLADIIILGTGDTWGAVTLTADATAVRAAAAQGVPFQVQLHSPASLTGQ